MSDLKYCYSAKLDPNDSKLATNVEFPKLTAVEASIGGSNETPD
jgi:hypothetical protein